MTAIPELGPVTDREYLIHIGVIAPIELEQDACMTLDQVRQRFKEKGLTFSQWARDNGYPVNKVHRIMAGIEKGYYGKAHEIAVKLGLKPDPTKTQA